MEAILDEYSTKRFYIEWDGYKSNHLSHGIVALHRIGADTKRLRDFADIYAKTTLEDRKDHPEAEIDSVKVDIDKLKGRKLGYYNILKHYEQKLQECGGDYVKLVFCEFPKLIQGIAGSALHGVIHTGYGLISENASSVCEGLAYSFMSYLPLELKLQSSNLNDIGSGDLNIIDVLQKIRNDDVIFEKMLSDVEAETDDVRKRGRFTPRMAALLGYQGDRLLSYAKLVKFPHYDCPEEETETLFSWLIDCAMTLYVCSERQNDFFFLHGVTSAWAMRHVLRRINDRDTSLKGIRIFLCVVMSLYTTLERPNLHLEFASNTPEQNSWRDLIQRAIAVENDEHVYKLVQVCSEMSKENKKNDILYKNAANIVLSEKYGFF